MKRISYGVNAFWQLNTGTGLRMIERLTERMWAPPAACRRAATLPWYVYGSGGPLLLRDNPLQHPSLDMSRDRTSVGFKLHTFFHSILFALAPTLLERLQLPT